MAQFGVTPMDFMGAGQEWQQTLAQTAQMQQQAKQAQLNVQLTQQRMQQAQQAQIQDLAFQQAVQQIPKTLPAYQRISRMADIAMEHGRYRDAETLIQRANQTLAQESLLEVRTAREAEAKSRAGAVRVERMLQLYSGVNSPETLRLANEIYRKEFDEDSPFEGRPYSPDMVKFATTALTKKRDEAAINKDRTAAVANTARAAKTNIIADADKRLKDARTAAVEAKTASAGKAQGKVVTPSRGEVTLAEDAIREKFPNLPASELKIAAREIASDAKMRQRETGGEFKDNALKVIDADASRFQSKVEKGGIFTPDKTRTGFVGKGAKPMDLPRTADGKPDQSQLKKDSVYQTAVGPARWTGTGFLPVEGK